MIVRYYDNNPTNESANHYEILGIDQTATFLEIRKAYNAALILHHPDNGGNTTQLMKVREAYKILSNPENRKNYDEDLQWHKSWDNSFKSLSDHVTELMQFVRKIKQNRVLRLKYLCGLSLGMNVSTLMTAFIYPSICASTAIATIPLNLYILKQVLDINADINKDIMFYNNLLNKVKPLCEEIAAHNEATQHFIEETTPRLEWKK